MRGSSQPHCFLVVQVVDLPLTTSTVKAIKTLSLRSIQRITSRLDRRSLPTVEHLPNQHFLLANLEVLRAMLSPDSMLHPLAFQRVLPWLRQTL